MNDDLNKAEKLTATEKILAEAITEKVCAQFMDWLGYQKANAPFDLKADIYIRVSEVFENGVEI